MESLEQIKARTEAAVPGAKIDIVPNPGPANQPSLLIDNEHAAAIAAFFARRSCVAISIFARTRPEWIGLIAR